MFLERKPLRLRNKYHTTFITSITFYDELILYQLPATEEIEYNMVLLSNPAQGNYAIRFRFRL
ncbi:hypothetical protein ASPTUDRAFT_49066 [Aspergillus tubingensis CBS 134.48]|uniref:Uncharacterized protein n=1 Tax=Aspergillus tubingensis (strain CBS 134.48) TaxID=767770 RepID=A0A1L9NJG5_ASPTC|nr:hypothetical protein ASPTUDRAFT_49066 [Aspergillus tubingensis CBS 134.48]